MFTINKGKSDFRSVVIWVAIGIFMVFSSLVKAIDLFSLSAKIEEYARIFNLSVPKMLCEVGALTLIGFEMTIGLLMVNGTITRYLYRLINLVFIFFSILTLYMAITAKVDDCGCLGSSLSITPWVSFIKNIILLCLLWCFRPKVWSDSHFENKDFYIILLTVTFCVITALNQPLRDFSKYNVGNKLYINLNNPLSMDIDFLDSVSIENSTLVFVSSLDEKVLFEISSYIKPRNSKPIIITPEVSKDIYNDLSSGILIGMIDRNSLSKIVSTEMGIITLDGNSTIISKWQKDYMNLQKYDQNEDRIGLIDRMGFVIAFILILVVSIRSSIISLQSVYAEKRIKE